MFSDKDMNIITSVLGDEFVSDLKKSEVGGGLFKKTTKTVLDPAELKIALQIVPRTILSFLFAHLKHRHNGDVIDLPLPFAENALLHLNKKGPDNYNGEVIQNGEVLYEIKHRSIPGIGLILLTTFELYDLSLLEEVKQSREEQKEDCVTDKLQDMIDSKLMMHRFVQDVVDRRISEKEAIDKLVKERLHAHIMQVNTPKVEEPMEADKKSKLREFLESREQKREEAIELDKHEIHCLDCGSTLHNNNEPNLTLCICYGDFHNKTIKIKKQETGKVKLKFPKSFDIDNVEMLLETLKNK
jgi:hypothetical protein